MAITTPGGGPSIHATAVLIGARALLIRGPSGSGKSILALRLIQTAEAGRLPFARLVGDDRVHIASAHGRLLVRPAPALAGLLEIRGLEIRYVPFEPVAVAGGLVDLGEAADRLPADDARIGTLGGVLLPRLAVARGIDPIPAVIAFWHQIEGSQGAAPAPI
jgi:hypothetical protein